MQLKHKQIAGLISLASTALLTNTTHAEENWDINTALLYYSEENRVSAVEPVISAKRDFGDDEFLNLKLTIDSLTGASATGAVPSSSIQTFTRPSGEGSYQTPANQTPLDDTFKDDRTALSASWEKPIDRNNRRTFGINISSEYDFFSIGANALWQHDLNKKNTTLLAGISAEIDTISAVGGTPDGLTDITLASKSDPGSQTKEITDLIVGVTQVIDAQSLFQLNYSLSQSNGYMTDPYKMVSIVDATGELTQNIYEHRPNSRNRQSIFGKYKKSLNNKDIVTLSYRFMTDDWGVNSHTIDTQYKFKMSDGYFLQPHLRLYQQTAADFYRYFLTDTEAIPTYLSADYRLGDMTATTIGLKFGQEIKKRHVWSARFELYKQSGDSSPSEAIGQLKNQDLYPDVNATLVQLNYSFKW